jgi:hypothetical protein
MKKILEKKIKTLTDASFIPYGLNIPIDMKIVDVRATNYQYYGNKYAGSNESYENKAVSIKISHSKMDNDFWITIFQGATYRDEDTRCIIATFEPTIDERFNITSSEETLGSDDCVTLNNYKDDGITINNDAIEGIDSINEVLFAFKCRLFDGDESELYTKDGATFDKNSNVLQEVIDELISLSFVAIDEKISNDNPNIKQLKEINEKLLSAASGNFYTVTVVHDGGIKAIHQYLEKEEAEELFVSYCLKYYSEKGLEQFISTKGCRSYDELSIEELEGYFHSEAWYDENDLSNIEINLM